MESSSSHPYSRRWPFSDGFDFLFIYSDPIGIDFKPKEEPSVHHETVVFQVDV